MHKLAGYAAITQFLEPETEDNKVYVVLACPLSVLKVKEELTAMNKGNLVSYDQAEQALEKGIW